MKKFAIWEKREVYSSELLEISTSNDVTTVNSTIISLESGSPLKINYQITLNRWFTKNLYLNIPHLDKSLFIQTNPKRQWFDKEQNELTELYGAIDIDLSCTPFTNTLPINRSNWIINQPQIFHMVYIKVPELTLKKVKQIYTLIKDEDDYQLFSYRSATFQTTIMIDRDGLVIDYPKLFHRKY
ncbi:putative glycolipid-binding domain-containing protein [Bacillus sp. 1P06AnD]|uniref:putative glycolipid-binding domain-containing protein n=1 Tax=Bacillus sp. 1P06AnD TaxID=3132208 RepID=UPI00399F2243